MIDLTGTIKFTHGLTIYTLNFERYYHSDQIERIRVFGRERELLLQSDRPDIKGNNRRKAVKWKIISDARPEMFKNAVFINMIFLTLEYELNNIEYPKAARFNW